MPNKAKIDIWKDKPVYPQAKGGIWTRKRMVKDANSKWHRVGRLIKRYYCDKY